MKRYLWTAALLCLLAFLLKYPKEALAASKDGMRLWLNTLLPTLLPFLILTGLLIHTGAAISLPAPLAFLLKILLGLSPWGFYACFLGKLCGCPMGAKVCAELYRSGKISRREGEYLLTFCANPSPAFLTSYLCEACLKGKIPTAKVLGTLLLSDMLCMLFFRFAVYKGKTVLSVQKTPETYTSNLNKKIPETAMASPSKKETPNSAFFGAALDVSIMNGFETITRIGGYILLFSILSACLSHFNFLMPAAAETLLPGILELTTGLHRIAENSLSFPARYLWSMVMTAFGGLCILAQTKSVLEGELSLIPYASARCLNAVLTAALAVFLN